MAKKKEERKVLYHPNKPSLPREEIRKAVKSVANKKGKKSKKAQSVGKA